MKRGTKCKAFKQTEDKKYMNVKLEINIPVEITLKT